MFYTGHGGSCCGISHVWGIGRSPMARNNLNGYQGNSRDCLDRVIRLNHGTEAFRVLEVVTAQDVDDEGSGTNQTEDWEDTLVELGFQKVSSFVNSNSYNVCTVWHKHPELTLYGELRYVEGLPPAMQEARAEVRPVLVKYCPNFRATGRGRMFSSAEEVRISYPLVRQIDRRTVYSDGSTVWEENV